MLRWHGHQQHFTGTSAVLRQKDGDSRLRFLFAQCAGAREGSGRRVLRERVLGGGSQVGHASRHVQGVREFRGHRGHHAAGPDALQEHSGGRDQSGRHLVCPAEPVAHGHVFGAVASGGRRVALGKGEQTAGFVEQAPPAAGGGLHPGSNEAAVPNAQRRPPQTQPPQTQQPQKSHGARAG